MCEIVVEEKSSEDLSMRKKVRKKEESKTEQDDIFVSIIDIWTVGFNINHKLILCLLTLAQRVRGPIQHILQAFVLQCFGAKHALFITSKKVYKFICSIMQAASLSTKFVQKTIIRGIGGNTLQHLVDLLWTLFPAWDPLFCLPSLVTKNPGLR